MQKITHVRSLLGESPLWHPQQQKYYWVDILKGHIHSLSADKMLVETIELPDKVGCIVLLANGNLMAALSRSIIEVDIVTHEVTCLCEPDLHPDEMFNDGKLDKQDRFWVATKDINEINPIANLYCFDGKTLVCKQKEVIVGNGIDWSRDGSRMYFTDSPRQTIYQYDFDQSNGLINHRRQFAKVSRGYPDGLCVDSKGNVWSAHWDGACITCYSPDGEVKRVIDLPCQRPTSCCFGNDNEDELFITSASVGLDITDSSPDGYVFRIMR